MSRYAISCLKILTAFAELVFRVYGIIVYLCFYGCEQEYVGRTVCLSAFLCNNYFITITSGDCKLFLLANNDRAIHVI